MLGCGLGPNMIDSLHREYSHNAIPWKIGMGGIHNGGDDFLHLGFVGKNFDPGVDGHFVNIEILKSA
jgi:hypothetical protein